MLFRNRSAQQKSFSLMLVCAVLIIWGMLQGKHETVQGSVSTESVEGGELVNTPYYSFMVTSELKGASVNMAIKNENYDIVIDVPDDTLSKSHPIALLSLVCGRSKASEQLKKKGDYCLGTLEHQGSEDLTYYLLFRYGSNASEDEKRALSIVFTSVQGFQGGPDNINTFTPNPDYEDGELP